MPTRISPHRASLLASLEPGVKRKVSLAVREGKAEEGDPEPWLEVVFDSGGRDPLQAQSDVLDELYGAREYVTRETEVLETP